MTTSTPPQPAPPPAAKWDRSYGEPPDGTIVVFAHPFDHQAERAFMRNDESAEESGYADEGDGPTGRHWYEVAEFPEAPCTWGDLTGGWADDRDVLFVFRLPAPDAAATKDVT